MRLNRVVTQTALLLALLVSFVLIGCGGTTNLGAPLHEALLPGLPDFPVDKAGSVATPIEQDGSAALNLSANAAINGSNLILPGTPNTLEYGHFEFSTGGDPIVSIAVQKQTPAGQIFVGVANYNTMRWQILGPFGNVNTSISLVGGNYTSPSGRFYCWVGNFESLTSTVTKVTLTVDSTIATFGISGSVMNGAVGEPGVSMALSGDGTGNVVTDANGAYSFTGLPAGNYVVTPSKGGFLFTPPSANVPLTVADATGVNFTAQPVAGTFNVTGRLVRPHLTPVQGIAGATVTLLDNGMNATTDAQGFYTITGVPNGGYILQPTKTGAPPTAVQFVPSTFNVLVNNADTTVPDITCTVTYESGEGLARMTLQARCTPCHFSSSDGGRNFSNYANVTSTDTVNRIIERGVNLQTMPPSNPKWDAGQRALMQAWAAASAPQ